MITSSHESHPIYAPEDQRLRLRFDGGVEKREDGKVWEDGKYLVFPLMCLVGGVEKWEDRKLFCLVREKKEKDAKYNLCKLTTIPLLHNM